MAVFRHGFRASVRQPHRRLDSRQETTPLHPHGNMHHNEDFYFLTPCPNCERRLRETMVRVDWALHNDTPGFSAPQQDIGETLRDAYSLARRFDSDLPYSIWLEAGDKRSVRCLRSLADYFLKRRKVPQQFMDQLHLSGPNRVHELGLREFCLCTTCTDEFLRELRLLDPNHDPPHNVDGFCPCATCHDARQTLEERRRHDGLHHVSNFPNSFSTLLLRCLCASFVFVRANIFLSTVAVTDTSYVGHCCPSPITVRHL